MMIGINDNRENNFNKFCDFIELFGNPGTQKPDATDNVTNLLNNL